MARSKGRVGRPWQRLRAQVIAEAIYCHLCGQPLDKTRHHPHPQSPTVDHLIALTDGGHPTDRTNLVAVCFRCNLAKEARRRRDRTLNASRDW